MPFKSLQPLTLGSCTRCSRSSQIDSYLNMFNWHAALPSHLSPPLSHPITPQEGGKLSIIARTNRVTHKHSFIWCRKHIKNNTVHAHVAETWRSKWCSFVLGWVAPPILPIDIWPQEWRAFEPDPYLETVLQARVIQIHKQTLSKTSLLFHLTKQTSGTSGRFNETLPSI